jgi:SAM-dependent methyltransferase
MNKLDLLITAFSYIRQSEKRSLIRLGASLKGKKGLEIGGPTKLFSLKGIFPVYLYSGQVDSVNYSSNTIWEGALKEGHHFHFHRKKGHQYIREATDLNGIPNESYDFVLSSHSLEHIANPLKAVQEWKSKLKPGGLFILVLPDKRLTFDSHRTYTSFEHLLEDFRQNRGEDDHTHFNEVLEVGHYSVVTNEYEEELRKKVYNNFENRCVHHHVFNFELIDQILQYFSFDKIYQQEAKPFHLITVARKAS